MDYTWDLAVIWIPLLGGTAVYALWILAGWAARRSDAVDRFLALAAQAVAVAGLVWTAWTAVDLFLKNRGVAMLWMSLEKIDLGPVVLAAGFRADALSTLIVLAASVIALGVVLYSLRAMAGRERQSVYYAWILWTVAAVSAAALADTYLVLIVAWEVATVMLYLLIGLGRPEGRAHAMKTFAILGLADVCLLLGVAILLGMGAVGKDLVMAGDGIGTESSLATIAYLLMAAAALAKAGAMPLHTWIPSASEDAPTPVFALLPAALDKLLGIYLLVRITFSVFQVGTSLAQVLMVIGAVTILAAVMMAMIQHNLKRLLAFHAVSQVGYMVLGLGLAAFVLATARAAGGPMSDAVWAVATIAFAGGLFHMLNHAIYKCTLFLTAGSVERVAGTMDLDRLGGLARRLPVTFVCCVVAALAISGVPPMNGFVSKWLVYCGALGAATPLAIVCLVVAVFGSALTLASFVKVIHSVFLGTRGSAVPSGPEQPRESLAMAVPMIGLAAACVALGIGGGWAVSGLVLPAAQAVGIQPAGVETAGGWLLELQDGKGFWSPVVATALILAGVAIGLLIYMVGRAMPIRVVPNFVGGENEASDATWHVSGTGFYETIRKLPGLAGLFRDGSAGAFDLYRVTGRYGGTLVGMLSGWHTGLLATYASWILIGLAVLVLVLALH